MNPQDIARAGIWMLKQAVLEYLRSRGGRALSTEVRDDLNLGSESDSGHGDNLAWGIANLLRADGSVRNEQEPEHGNHGRMRNWMVLCE